MSLTKQEKDRARGMARRAHPVLTKCERCPATERLQRHHPDLNDPLTVIVLCKTCHVAEHQSTGGFGGAVRNSRYPQFAEQLRERIKAAEYTHTIPSIEQLRRETGLAAGTIQAAVRLLVEEGWLLISPGKGTFVQPGEWPADEYGERR